MSIGISDNKQKNIEELAKIEELMEKLANKDYIHIPRQPGEKNMYEEINFRKIKEERNASKQAQQEYIGKKRYS